MKSTTDDDRIAWVVYVGAAGHVYCFLHLTGRFHENPGLRHDYYAVQDSSYTDIDAEEAVRLINEGVGQHNPSNKAVARRIADFGANMTAEEVLGEVAAGIRRS